MAIFSYFAIGTFFNVKRAHFHHCPLEIKEEHGFVQSIAIDNASCFWGGIQCLIRTKHPGFPQQCVVVKIVESGPCCIEGLFCIISSTACFGQCVCKACIQSRIYTIQSAFE